MWFKRKNEYSLPLDPTDAVTDGPIVNTIPAPRRYNLYGFVCDSSPNTHTGAFSHAVDFAVPDGSIVLAARSGTVVDVVEHNNQYGDGAAFSQYLNYLTVDHGDNEYSQYAHLQEQSVSATGLTVGTNVVRGQQLARVGKTGWVEGDEYGDHLHFMVFKIVTNTEDFISIPITWKK